MGEACIEWLRKQALDKLKLPELLKAIKWNEEEIKWVPRCGKQAEVAENSKRALFGCKLSEEVLLGL